MAGGWCVDSGMTVERVWSDLELVEGLAERREEAFTALVEAYTDRLFGLAWRVTGSREDAEEAVQDAFVRAHRALFEQYSATRVRELSPRPWLFAVVLNAARNRRRGRKAERSLDERSTDGRLVIEPPDPGASPGTLVESSELGKLIEQELLRLPRRQRAAVVLRLAEGLSYDEVAQIVGAPVGTVKSDVHRGLRTLRQALGGRLE